MSAAATLGRCVPCTAGNHESCDSPGSPTGLRCTCCPDAVARSAGRQFNDALFDSNHQHEGARTMPTTTNTTPSKSAAKATTRGNVVPIKKAADKKAAPTKAAAPKADAKVDAKPKPESTEPVNDKCPKCGYTFPEPRPGTCRSASACKRRQTDPGYRVPGQSNGGDRKAAKAVSSAKKAAHIQNMTAERKAMKAWKDGGSKGTKPETPLLDKIEAEYAAKQAAKSLKVEVTPIPKAASK